MAWMKVEVKHGNLLLRKVWFKKEEVNAIRVEEGEGSIEVLVNGEWLALGYKLSEDEINEIVKKITEEVDYEL